MHYAYILESEVSPGRHYIGSTDDLKRRLGEHNAGKCVHSEKFRPWSIKTYFAFREKSVAQRFERYLKTGSGREFARRHFE